MTQQRRKTPVEDAARLEELERLAHSARTREVAAESEMERYFRLADEGLQSAYVNLRRLRRQFPAARDALKLTRQAQNLLMDAEDDAA